ncbi:MAG: hypothetical protein IID32_10065 [Planctomycetes bacterium]|nr:hypothetical protein [Planctomycetota bacterium]
MHADTVFNFYQPDYSSGGDISAAGLFDPELQIANDSTIPNRYNKFWEVLYNEDYNNSNNTRWDWIIDLRQFQQYFDFVVSGGATQLEAAEALVDLIDLKLNAGMLKAKYAATPAPNPRSIIIDTVEAQSNSNLRRGMSLTAPYLVITSPTYQVQQ